MASRRIVGLLLDSLSQNTGDQAILEVMLAFLRRRNQEIALLSPLGFDPSSCGQIIVGGGHLLRDRGDWFYDVFRAPGRHILNTPGVSTADHLEYLREYEYVSVRSQADLERVAGAVPGAVVRPCVSLALEASTEGTLSPAGSIGFHFHDQSWASCGDDSLLLEYKDYPQCLIPVTHYNGDYWLLKRLSERLSHRRVLLPRLPPARLLGEIGRLRALVCSSLHASIFAYSRNVPFLAFGYPPKIVEFMEDRGLGEWIFRDRAELRAKLARLLDSPPDYSTSLQRDVNQLEEHLRRIADCLPKGMAAATAELPRPNLEHQLLVEHHNRLATVERLADQLLSAAGRIQSDSARQDSRLDQLRRRIEEGSAGDVVPAKDPAGPRLSVLPFGIVESPQAGAFSREEFLVSGWALCASGISQVAVYLDGHFAGSATLGNERTDVASAYPGFPDNPSGGWHFLLDVRSAAEGRHELMVQGHSRLGMTRDIGSLWVTIGQNPEAPPVSVQDAAATVGAAAIGMRIDSLAEKVRSLSEAQRATRNQISETAKRNRAALRRASRETEEASRAISGRLASLEQKTMAAASQIQSISDSRIWKLLQMLAAPLYRFTSAGRAPRPAAAHTGEREDASPPGLRCAIDSPVPASLTIGKGGLIHVAGWCYHPTQEITSLEIGAGIRTPVKARGMLRPDVLNAHFPRLDPAGRSLSSGFWGLAVFPEGADPGVADLALHAVLESGEECTFRIGQVALSASVAKGTVKSEPSGRPLIAICMATYNPPMDLFARQIQSIRDQSWDQWICIISDDNSSPERFEAILALVEGDPRFEVHQPSARLGFYRNFEHCLSHVPAAADFIALSDHDDFWHPDKLATLFQAFEPDTILAYSDMNITGADGKVLSPTYWSTRRNNYTNLVSLYIANTVTGAASMFRRSLLDLLLPFPLTPGEPYHDHWMACAALSVGKIAYVGRPLYDYVQHQQNVIGHFAPKTRPWTRELWDVLWSSQPLEGLWRDIYFGDVLRVQMIAAAIKLRAGSSIPAGKRRGLEALSRMDESFLTGVWLPLRRLRKLVRGDETLGAETRLFLGILWKHYAGWRSRSANPKAWLRAAPTPPPASSIQTAAGAPVEARTSDNVDLIARKIAPLSLHVSAEAPESVNFLIPTIDFAYVFGGYVAKFNLVRKLAEQGFRVRLVIVDHCDYEPELWKRQFRQFEGTTGLLDHCELAYAFDRKPLTVSPRDSFLATTWWTAHIARRASQRLGQHDFLYLIQEFEPFTFPMGALASLARETYDWPHFALFSTELLRGYFREQRIGVFAAGPQEGERRSAVFNNAITMVAPVSHDELSFRKTRRLLYYARPESHAARNMFELGMIALGAAIEAGIFDERWRFTGIGSVGNDARIPLPGGRHLRLLRRQNQKDYGKILSGHDLGLSLMYTPHPSLVPIEMASSGMIVVTNTFANKTQERLQAISSNLLGVEPSIEGVVAGLGTAVSLVSDVDRRIAGSQVKWARTWDESFDQAFMDRVAEFLGMIPG